MIMSKGGFKSAITLCVAVALLSTLLFAFAFQVNGSQVQKSNNIDPSAASIASIIPTATSTAPWAAYLQMIQVPRDAQEAEAIPTYPDVLTTTVTPSNFQHQPPEVRFTTQDDVATVAKFYDTVLSAMQWQAVGGHTEYYTGGRIFTWNPDLVDKDAQYRLVLYLHIVAGEDYATPGTIHQPTNVNLWVIRWPFSSRVPLYPDATDIQIVDTPTELAYVTRTTTYHTNASLDQVEDFYKTQMAASGWTFGMPDAFSIGDLSQGLVFTDQDMGLDRYLMSKVVVNASKGADGKVGLQLRRRGLTYRENRGGFFTLVKFDI